MLVIQKISAKHSTHEDKCLDCGGWLDLCLLSWRSQLGVWIQIGLCSILKYVICCTLGWQDIMKITGAWNLSDWKQENYVDVENYSITFPDPVWKFFHSCIISLRINNIHTHSFSNPQFTLAPVFNSMWHMIIKCIVFQRL